VCGGITFMCRVNREDKVSRIAAVFNPRFRPEKGLVTHFRRNTLQVSPCGGVLTGDDTVL